MWIFLEKIKSFHAACRGCDCISKLFQHSPFNIDNNLFIINDKNTLVSSQKRFCLLLFNDLFSSGYRQIYLKSRPYPRSLYTVIIPL